MKARDECGDDDGGDDDSGGGSEGKGPVWVMLGDREPG